MRFISWLALASIFVSGIYVETRYGVLFLSYIFMLAAYAPAVILTGSLGIRKEYVAFLVFLVGASFVGYLVSIHSYGLELSRLLSILAKIGMLAFFIFFFTAIYNVCNKSAVLLFKRYLRVAQFFALVGVVQELIFVAVGIDVLSYLSNGAKNYGTYLGVAGLSVEPAFYACSLLPAGAYYVSKLLRGFSWSFGATLVIAAIFLSTSSLGYLGLFISAVITLLFSIRLRHIWVLAVGLPLLVLGAYQVSQLSFFKMRMNDTISVLRGAELTMSTGMNISTYSLAVNMSMSFRSLKDSYGVGVGFGDYSSVFDLYITDYEMPNYRDDFPGRGSATSLFARLTAELGVTAWLVFIAFIYAAWSEIRRGKYPAIVIGYTATLAIILLRMGEYYVNGVVLVFLMIYLLHCEGLIHRKLLKQNKDKI